LFAELISKSTNFTGSKDGDPGPTVVTLSCHAELETLPIFAVISAVPAVRAVTSPAVVIVATPGALLNHSIPSLTLRCCSSECFAVNLSFQQCPTV
jgi:hypothetical protein